MHDKAFNIAKNPKYDGYQRGLASMVYKFFDKKSASLAQPETLATRDKSAPGGLAKNGNMLNQELSEDQESWLGKHFREMYLKYNEGKSVVAEGFIKTLKNNIYKYITSISKNHSS